MTQSRNWLRGLSAFCCAGLLAATPGCSKSPEETPEQPESAVGAEVEEVDPQPEVEPEPAAPVAAATTAVEPVESAAAQDEGTAGVPENDAPAAEARVVFLGDSLTSGLYLELEQAYPALLEAAFKEGKTPFLAINAGVAGDNSAGGLKRVHWLLNEGADVLVVALGATDGLRGMPAEELAGNLRGICKAGRDQGVRLLLVGMPMPPSYGRDYVARFNDVYPGLAEELKLTLVPSLMEGVSGAAELTMADGTHPNAQGHQRMAANVEPALRQLLEELRRQAE